MPSVIVAGGGLAGMAATAALASAGYHVDLFESRPFLGGRATSYTSPQETVKAKLSTIVSTSCSGAALIYWIFTRGSAYRIR